MATTQPTPPTGKDNISDGVETFPWKNTLNDSIIIRGILLISFFAIYIFLALHSVASETVNYVRNISAFSLAQIFTLVVIFTSLKKRNSLANKRIFVIWGASLAQLLAIQVIAHYTKPEVLAIGPVLLPLILPYIFAPMIATVLLGRRMGIFTTYLVSFFCSPLLPPEQALPCLVLSLIAGSITVVATFRTRSRGQLLKAGLYSGLGVLLISFLYGLLPPPGTPGVSWPIYIAAICCSPLVAIILGGLFPLLESLFSITTLTGWLERSDLNKKLLRRLQLEAPGTFHHSLMVAQLSEAAAEAIGANSLECRVCSYYHDIGKLTRPEYFTENMVDKEHSPHNDLTPLMSAKILMKHVDDGVALAQKHNLERHIIATIKEHHGTSMVSFLYQKALIIRDEMMEKVDKGLANIEDVVYPEESQFRYAGPIPQSRETAIVSLADAVESASRSLQHPTEEEIHELVERIVRYRVNEGQLDDSRLTLGEIKTIKKVFLTTIKSMLHSRISYPKEATNTKGDKDADTPSELPKEKIASPLENASPEKKSIPDEPSAAAEEKTDADTKTAPRKEIKEESKS